MFDKIELKFINIKHNGMEVLPREIVMIIFKLIPDEFLTFIRVSRYYRYQTIKHIMPCDTIRFRAIKMLAAWRRYIELDIFIRRGNVDDYDLIEWLGRLNDPNIYDILIRLPPEIFRIKSLIWTFYRTPGLLIHVTELRQLAVKDIWRTIDSGWAEDYENLTWLILLMDIGDLKVTYDLIRHAFNKCKHKAAHLMISHKNTDRACFYKQYDWLWTEKVLEAFINDPKVNLLERDDIFQKLAGCRKNHTYMNLLEKTNKAFTKDYKKSFHMACTSNNSELVQFLLKDNRFTAKTLIKSLGEMCTSKFTEDTEKIIRIILADSRITDDPNEWNVNNLLCYMTGFCIETEVVASCLRDSRINPSIKNNAYIIRAIENDLIRELKLFLNDKRVTDANSSKIIKAALKLEAKFQPTISRDYLKVLLESRKMNFKSMKWKILQCSLSSGCDGDRYFDPDAVTELVLDNMEYCGLDPRENRNKLLTLAIQHRPSRLFEKILKLDIDLTAYNNAALKTAVRTVANIGDDYRWALSNLILLLNDKRIDPAADNNWAIRYAAAHDNVDLMKLLLQFDVDPMANNPRTSSVDHDQTASPFVNNNGEALINAIVKDNIAILSLLLADKRTNPAVANNCPLRMAVKYRNIEVVKMILSSGHPVNIKAKSYYAVKYAANHEFHDIFRVLLEYFFSD